MSDGIYFGHEKYYSDVPVMILEDMAELDGLERKSGKYFMYWNEAIITTIQCKHCNKSFVPTDEDWTCFYCKISNLL